MNLKQGLEKLYITLQSNQKLLRLLHYIPKNSLDNPLDEKKKDVNDLPNKHEIIKKILIPSDKTYDLVLNSKMCRICFYTGSRKLQTGRNGFAGRLQDNPYAADQIYNFDVYVHVDIDIEDFRMLWICDTLNEILNNESVVDVGTFRLAFSSPINNTPDGFIGYKMAYITNSLQDSNEE